MDKEENNPEQKIVYAISKKFADAGTTGSEGQRSGPAATAGTWNRRKIKGGIFLKNTELIDLISKAESLPRIDYLHGEEYPRYNDGQQEPEPLPEGIPGAIIKVSKRMKTGKAPASHIYLPEEYGGRAVLVLALTPEQRYLIMRAEDRRNALEILNEYPDDEVLLSQSVYRTLLDNDIPPAKQYAEALPEHLKRQTPGEIEAHKGEILPDGTLLRGAPQTREKVKKQIAEKAAATNQDQKKHPKETTAKKVRK